MKWFLCTFFFCLISLSLFSQQDKPIWISTGLTGNIYAINLNNCTAHFVCATGKNFYDIALTPNGKLWGRTQDSLFRIDTTNGYTTPIGRVPIGNSLVGLNDSTLLIDSLQYLYAINTFNASKKLVGYIGYVADGDLTWLGKDLYMVGQGFLVKIILNETYANIQGITTKALPATNAYNTPALATAYISGLGHETIIALPGNVDVYSVDTSNAAYNQVCSNNGADSSWGGASMTFPPDPPPVSVRDIMATEIQFSLYPNPASGQVYISLQNFEGNTSDITLSLYDYTGRLLLQQELNSLQKTIGLADFRPGMYFIRVYWKGQCLGSQKMIKL